ncbi:MAG: hypothetical protein WC736_10045 [Gallionella sp.]|jgi:hypothetical protein
MGEIHNLLMELESRQISFRILSNILRLNDIPSAKGWSALLQKNFNDPTEQKLKEEWGVVIKDIYLNNLYYGDKAISIYKIEDENILPLLPEKLSELVSKDSPYIKKYPFSIQDDELRNLSSHSVGTKFEVISSDSCRVVFCAKRYIKAKTEINFDDYEQSVREAFSGFDEVIGIQRGCAQCFDILHFDQSKNQLEIQIDLHIPLTGDEINRIIRQYEVDINNWSIITFEGKNLLGKPLNLFPKVRLLYDNPEGNVMSLGHSTSTASIKDERMRGKQTDLRHEPFHLGGLQGVNNLTDLYSITKNWSGANNFYRPELSIPGHFSLVGNPNAHIFQANIRGCVSNSDFRMVISKIS